MDNKITVRLLVAAGALMLLAGGIFGFLKLWLYSALLAAGTSGCLIGVMNFKSRKDEDGNGRLISLPAKHKKKLLALWYLAGKFEAGREYSEPEINDLLDEWTLFHDPATLRRELYNKRLLDRTPDCRRYWKAEDIPALEAFIQKYV